MERTIRVLTLFVALMTVSIYYDGRGNQYNVCWAPDDKGSQVISSNAIVDLIS